MIAAAKSVLEQDCPPPFELIIVDNDPDGSALKAARKLARTYAHPVRVLHERRIGLHAARNAGVRAAGGEFVAFLDDNQTVSPRWLQQLGRVQVRTSADVVFGAIHARLRRDQNRHEQFYQRYFTRDPDHHEGLIEELYDCRCSLIRRDLLSGSGAFCLDAQEERDAIDPALLRMKADGRSIAWAGSAWVWQAPQVEQMSILYAMRSAYNLSRERTAQAISGSQRGLRVGLVSLLSGGALVFGAAPVALAMYCVRARGRAFAYRKVADGLGRVLWGAVFRLRGPDPELMPVAR